MTSHVAIYHILFWACDTPPPPYSSCATPNGGRLKGKEILVGHGRLKESLRGRAVFVESVKIYFQFLTANELQNNDKIWEGANVI